VTLFDNIGGVEWLDWHLHLDVVLLCLGMLAGYWYAINELRPQISDAGRVKRSQTLCFCAGVLVIYIAAGSPMHDLSEQYLLSMHMLQHLLFTMVAPPLLLAGIPGWLWSALLRSDNVLRVAKVIVNPIVAFAVFNSMIVLTHLPNVVDFSLEHHWFHFFVHVALFSSAMMMWWPILSNVPELPRLSEPLQMAYLFVQSLLPAVIGAFLIFSTHAVYDFYGQAPRIWGISAVEDQQIAAGLMKTITPIILWSFIGVAFFRWYAREQAQDQEPRWSEVEEELQEMGLSGRNHPR
jgi:putative membrane protein